MRSDLPTHLEALTRIFDEAGVLYEHGDTNANGGEVLLVNGDQRDRLWAGQSTGCFMIFSFDRTGALIQLGADE